MDDVEAVGEKAHSELLSSDFRVALNRLAPFLMKTAGCVLIAGLIVVFLIVLTASDATSYVARWMLFLSLVIFLGGLLVRLVIALSETGFTRVVRAALGFIFVLAAAAISAISLVPPAP
jgi:hypothetical protein